MKCEFKFHSVLFFITRYPDEGGVSELLPFFFNDLVETGYLARDYTWHLESGQQAKLRHYRLRDNYLRFYLRYIEPTPTSSGPIFKVPASGGTPMQITTLDRSRGEVGHRYPALLADGRRFLYVSIARDGKRWQCVGNTDGGEGRALGTAENVARPAMPGWVATVERQQVLVRPFDEGSVAFKGEPRAIAQCGARNKIGDSNLAADARGTIVYQGELKRRGWLRWYDISSRTLGPRICELDTPQEVALGFRAQGARDRELVAGVLGSQLDFCGRRPRRLEHPWSCWILAHHPSLHPPALDGRLRRARQLSHQV